MTHTQSIAVPRRIPRVGPPLALFVLAGLTTFGCTSTGGSGEPQVAPDTAMEESASSAESQQKGPSAAAKPPVTGPSLFDVEPCSLKGWRVIDDFVFDMHGDVYVKDGRIVLEAGAPATGIKWTGTVPEENYQVTLEAMRVDGHDFFCGLTFPVGGEPCTLILGGWSGMVVGLSNIDHMHAAENETTTSHNFKNGTWYKVELRVTNEWIRVWIDDHETIALERGDHGFSIWAEQEPTLPFGIATWYTTGALRNIKVRPVAPES